MRFVCNEGAPEQELTIFRKVTGLTLPEDYLSFMRRCNGGEGYIGDEYLMLWRLGELEKFNREYEVHEYIPDVLLFGSTGGGDAYGFRTILSGSEVVKVPFIGMSSNLCKRIAGSFTEFLETLERT